MAIDTKLMTELKNILQEFDDRYFVDGKMKRASIIDDLNNYNADLISALLKSETIKKNYLKNVDGNNIFKLNQFIEILQYKEFWQDSYTKYANKIGLATGGKFIDESEDIVLDFPFKDTILKASMSKEDRNKEDLLPDEPFLNTILAKEEIDVLFDKKILYNVKKFDKNEKSNITEFSKTDSLVIKGNNLLALYLLKEKYAGKIKLIYLDPPYNTGKDSFIYNDSFNHSSWLTFMHNRLEIAKEFLSEDGVIIVQADDKMQAYLKLLMDDIFGKEQFETTFHIQVRYTNKTLSEDNDFQKVMEVAHVYSKNTTVFKPSKIQEEYSIDKFKYQIKELGEPYDIFEENGKRVEVFSSEDYEVKEIQPSFDGLKETWASGSLVRQGGTAAEFLDKYLIKRKEIGVLYKIYGMGSDGLGYRYVLGPKKKGATRGKFYSGIPIDIKSDVISGKYCKEKPIPNLLDNELKYEDAFGNIRHEGGVDIGGGKKPECLIKFFTEYFTSKQSDIILDFFGGSGTTASTAMKLGHPFIIIEQLNSQIELILKRLNNVINGDKTGISSDEEVGWKGGGSFIYAELMEKNRRYLYNIWDAKNENELKQVYINMKKSADIDFRVDLNKVNDSLWSLPFDEQKLILINIIDKNQLYYNYSEIEDEEVRKLISESDYKFNKCFYKMESGL
ncbi:site-specific DNA-methyltransferase [Clostridioides sp. ZZV14-6387]|uniref:DNA methyltransferase n=1 Tax=Clostridioides sp. ZZV14-6387 TaxID=2811497 RepID=UPI001D0FB773|nr:site-specific DNA-methyltransferase [Clostridioides sp. ZZV14-6387]